jgi:hypothetical protein
MWLVSKITGLIKREPKENSARDVVVFKESDSLPSTYSEFYTVPICPKCKHILDATKARYNSKCCYLCGYTNGEYLFDPEYVVVRDRFVDSYYVETMVHERR